MNSSVKSISLLCDLRGTILNHLNDELGYAQYFPTGKLFLSCFSSDNFNKALEFTVHLKNSTSTFGWDILLPNGDSNVKLSFGGGIINSKLCIVASKERETTELVYNKLLSQYTGEKGNPNTTTEPQTMAINTRESLRLFNNELTRLNNEIVNYKKEISSKNKELEKLNEIKNQFLGMAAHDLRNPLGNIKSYTEFLLEDKKDLTDDHIKYVESIESLSVFMLSMVNDLLDISNIESGKLNLDLVETDICRLIQRNIHLNHLAADKKNIQIYFEPDEQTINVKLDQRKIDQVMTNLISNAIKYSFPKTKIIISVTADDSTATISIKDQGQGIPEAELPHLFKPFYKSSVQSTDGEKSTGLGLVIVRKIVEAHNGEITVKSKLGTGSTFTFNLPIMN